MYKILFIINLGILILTNTYTCLGQEHICFKHYKKFVENSAHKLYIGLENFNFVHNNEYESKFTNGTTWIGNLVNTKIYYYPSKHIRLETGIRMQKYSGLSNFSQIEPLLSVHYQAHKNIYIIVGNLNQNLNHKLTEPIFATEKFFTDKAQSGVELKYKDKRIDFDTWINWQNFITAKSINQEKLRYGIVCSGKINKRNSNSDVKLYGELYFSHKGGEVNSTRQSKKYRQTLGYFSAGISYKYTYKSNIIKSIKIKSLAYVFSDNSRVKEYIISDGHAFNPQLEIESKYGLLNISYWNSYNFMSDQGNQLYWSISKTQIHYNMIKHRREMFIIKSYLDKEISKGIVLAGDYKNYFDLRNAYYDFSIAIYLRINLNFMMADTSK